MGMGDFIFGMIEIVIEDVFKSVFWLKLEMFEYCVFIDLDFWIFCMVDVCVVFVVE